MDIFAFLDEHGIAYRRVDHPPVYTVAQARELALPLPGAHVKNLFLRNKAGDRHWLLVVGAEKQVDLQGVAARLEEKRLSLASARRLAHYLGVEPGAVSILALVNDRAGAVTLLVDRPLWDADALKCHPLFNTSTLAIPRPDLARFLVLTGHTPELLDVPSRA